MSSLSNSSAHTFVLFALALACLVFAATGLRSLKSATHEEICRDSAIEGPSDRGFGLVMGAFFLLAGLAPLRHRLPVRPWALLVALAFVLAAMLRPRLLAPLNRAWMALGRLLSRVMTPIVMGLLFYLVFTPAGVLYRLFGKDSLRLSARAQEETYWIEAGSEGISPESMLNQF